MKELISKFLKLSISGPVKKRKNALYILSTGLLGLLGYKVLCGLPLS